MPPTLHIVAACSDRKRGAVLAHHQLRAYGRRSRRAERWLGALGDGGERRPVEELYVGNHWFVARSITDEAASQGWHPELCAASAGAGLVFGRTSLPPYSATFAPRHADSVVDADASDAPEVQTRRWWRSLVESSGESFAAIARREPTTSMLVVASRSYIDAASDDLLEALGLLRDPNRVVIVTSEPPRERGLHSHVVTATANLCTRLGGAMTSLHARLARHLVTEIAPGDWGSDRARDVTAELTATSPARVIPQRLPVDDQTVRAFVRKQLRVDPDASATRLLRAFRESGQACEQKRFKQLVQSVGRN